MRIHVEFLKKSGLPQFAVIPYDEFKRIRDLLEDYEDLLDLEVAKAATKQTFDWELIKAEFRL